VPDRGGQGEEALREAREDVCSGTGAVLFEARLASSVSMIDSMR
jgi:hypothetical protein